MKILVTSLGSDLDAMVDPRFGRAQRFILVETDTEEFSVHDNTQNVGAAQGAGIQAGQTVAQLGAVAVVTGNVGPKAFATLQAGNIEVYTGANGTVREMVEQFKAGNLQRTDKPNVKGHWG